MDNYNFTFISTPTFLKQSKELHKKYPSLPDDLKQVLYELNLNPYLGSSLGKNCYKIRMSIKSKNKGKRSGARLLISLKIIENKIHLLSIYDKSEIDNFTELELQKLINEIG